MADLDFCGACQAPIVSRKRRLCHYQDVKKLLSDRFACSPCSDYLCSACYKELVHILTMIEKVKFWTARLEKLEATFSEKLSLATSQLEQSLCSAANNNLEVRWDQLKTSSLSKTGNKLPHAHTPVHTTITVKIHTHTRTRKCE
jgi:hypothetical protein